MFLRAASLLLIALLGCAGGRAQSAPVARVILVGDSTLAPGSGYGDALCARFDTSVTCLNSAKGGRSSKSYRAEGSWEKVLEALRTKPAPQTFVLIQFGHNDQPGKAERSTTLTEFAENLTRYVTDVRAAGATAVLVTPLTRRQFKERKVIRGLEAWAEATRGVALKMHVPLLDLHRDSVAAVEAMGPELSNTLAQADPPESVSIAAQSGTTIEAPKPARADPGNPVFDYTHLGAKGADVFASLVAVELRDAVPGLAARCASCLARPH